MLGIFEKLRLRYPNQWEHKIGKTPAEIDKAMEAWAEVLHDITAEELVAGFQSMDDAAPPHPPSVMEFKRLCRPASDKPTTAAHRPFPRLPRPKANHETVMANVDAMRRAITRREPA